MSKGPALRGHEELVVDYAPVNDTRKMLRFTDKLRDGKAFLCLGANEAIEPHHINTLRVTAAGLNLLPQFYSRYIDIEKKAVYRCYHTATDKGEEPEDLVVYLAPVEASETEQKVIDSFTE